MTYSPRIVDAFTMAYDLHREQFRKGMDVPYITHLAAVASLVGDYGGNEDQFIAALLHDAVEDQGGDQTLERIRDRFGTTVADYVSGCSDSNTVPRPAWQQRKEAFIQRIGDAHPDLKLIVAADKLHNARTTTSDLYESGRKVWAKFNGGKDGSLWYYAEMVRALSHGWTHPILRELARTVDALQRKAAE